MEYTPHDIVVNSDSCNFGQSENYENILIFSCKSLKQNGTLSKEIFAEEYFRISQFNLNLISRNSNFCFFWISVLYDNKKLSLNGDTTVFIFVFVLIGLFYLNNKNSITHNKTGTSFAVSCLRLNWVGLVEPIKLLDHKRPSRQAPHTIYWNIFLSQDICISKAWCVLHHQFIFGSFRW